ncbi:hypothetical protein P4S52_13595 [Vibrio sp. SA48]|uniref:hypothetical protein n=1 Tax=Vibrio sp. S12_S33 TaxID=2720223 RepID=UPI00178618A8|nr:hypothetical protein [Vibrio sp. S12_S33]MBD1566729.1 hypothetical protein [Vibrio sp. S12_S33]
MKSILPSLFYLVILSLISQISFAKNSTGPSGDVLQRNCVSIAEAYSSNLTVHTSASIVDTSTLDRYRYRDATININKGMTGTFCTETWDLGSINNEGHIDFEFRITNDVGHTLTSFGSYTDFDGSGRDNNWDINELGQCAAQGGYGVYLEALEEDDGPLTSTCGPLEVDNDDVASIIFVPEITEDEPIEHDTYRVNLSLLSSSFDGLRYGNNIFDLGDLVNKPIAEIIRRADMIAQQSELQGKIKVILPEETIGNKEITLIDTQNGTLPVNFLEPTLYSFTFSVPKGTNISDKITIECNITELDTINDDTICNGTYSYPYLNSTMFSTLTDISNAVSQQLNINKDANSIDTVVQLANFLGYEKLFRNNEPGKNLLEVINLTVDFIKESGSIVDILLNPTELDRYLKSVSGIYILNANITKIQSNIFTPNNNHLNLTWHVDYNGFAKEGQVGQAGAEIYGQLYYMPEAIGVNILELVPESINIPSDVKYLLKGLEIPFYLGDAIPVFNLDRRTAKDSGFGILHGMARSLESRINSKGNGAYFVNIWERDGDTTLDVDDCIGKGNAFGLDNKVESISVASSCDWLSDLDEDNKVNLNSSTNKDGDFNSGDIYIIEGVLKFTHHDGAGDQFEAYGDVNLTVNGQTIFNTTLKENETTNNNDVYQSIPFLSTIKSNSSPVFDLDIKIYELDTANNDDIINQYIPDLPYDIGVKKTLYLKGDNGGLLEYKVSKVRRKR